MEFKDLYEKKFLTAKKIAEQLGIDVSTVHKWNSGQFPTVEKILELKVLLKCSADKIINSILKSRKK